MTGKTATPDHPIHPLLSARWSPYAFADKPVSDADLRSLFEAARWAASSYNEQPWSFLVARRENAAEFAKMIACLFEPNQAWAKTAPVLALGVVRQTFSRNDKPNRAAVHDLGLASANLTFEASTRGLVVHQMIGILPDKARETYAIPAHSEAWTALAIGYLGDSAALPPPLKERDLAPRTRKPLREFVFGGAWGRAAEV